MLTLTAIGMFSATARNLSRGCSTLMAAVCLTLAICASAVSAELDLTAMYAPRSTPAAVTDDLDLSALYSRPAIMSAAPEVDLSALRSRPRETAAKTRPTKPAPRPPVLPVVQHVPQMQPAMVCVGSSCQYQPPQTKPRGLFGLLRK